MLYLWRQEAELGVSLIIRSTVHAKLKGGGIVSKSQLFYFDFFHVMVQDGLKEMQNRLTLKNPSIFLMKHLIVLVSSHMTDDCAKLRSDSRSRMLFGNTIFHYPCSCCYIYLLWLGSRSSLFSKQNKSIGRIEKSPERWQKYFYTLFFLNNGRHFYIKDSDGYCQKLYTRPLARGHFKSYLNLILIGGKAFHLCGKMRMGAPKNNPLSPFSDSSFTICSSNPLFILSMRVMSLT